MMRRFFLSLLIITCSLMLADCSNPYTIVKQTEDNISKNSVDIAKRREQLETAAPAVVMSRGYYVDDNPVDLNRSPWLKNKITLNAQGIPLNLLLTRILRNTNTSLSYQPGMASDVPVSITYSGTIQGALDYLADKTNYAYEIDGSNVYWQAIITKTFNISFMPGSSTYMVGGQGQSGDNTSSGSTGGGSSTNVSVTKSDLGDDQYSNMQGDLSVWDDLRKTLGELKSPEGKFWVSESTTTVTVRDRPSNIRAIANYINQLNKTMTKQVSIQVTVLELTLDKEFNYGIDWNLVARGVFGHNALNITGATGSAANVSGSATQGGSSSGLTTIGILRQDRNSSALINALSQQGKLSIVTQPTVVTMNNQVAAVRITRDTGYLQSVSSSVGGVSGTTSTSLTPGIVTDGFSLYLLPKIQSNKIYLQISSTLSNLTSIDRVSNVPNTNNNSSSTASTPLINPDNNNNTNNQTPAYQSIQVPTLAQKSFNQRTVLQSGSTLIITGFQQLRDQTNTNSPLGITALGGKGAQDENVQTIVCITPTIIETPN